MKNYDWVVPLVGLPWREYATGPDAFDCWGAVFHGYREHLGVDLNRHLEIPTADARAFTEAVAAEVATGHWQQLQQPEDGCLVLLSQSRLFHHIGMWLDVNGGRLLHAKQGLGVQLQPGFILNDYRRVEFWKYVGNAPGAAAPV